MPNRRSRARGWLRATAIAALVTGGVTVLAATPAAAVTQTASQCAFPNSQYQHVIYVQFDNTHLRRDNPNVPSDLEQIPALRDFLADNGSLMANDHTILISHTAGGIVSSLTGLYPDRNGINVANSYQFFTGDPLSTGFASAFSYWTDPVGGGDKLPNLVTTGGANTPAPWTPYVDSGCDVGAVATANIELENTSTGASGDITKVFGNGLSGLSSPQAAIAQHDSAEVTTDLEGVSIHCALADSGPGGLCSSANGGRPDTLPGQTVTPNGLFGALYANQVLSRPGQLTPATTDANSPTFNGQTVPTAAPPVKDVFNYTASPGITNPASQVIGDSSGHPGFPGFDPSAAQTLGYIAAMQEAGVPVTFAYIADAHDDHTGVNNFNAFGPGQAGYVAQLQAENVAFKAFFDRLAQDGINKSNTLFVFTVDEGDHYAGGPPTNPGCDGVTVPCTYGTGTTGPNSVGEQDVDLVNALKAETNDTIGFDVHADSAPTFYVHGSSSTSGPSPNDPSVRALERDVSQLTLTNARTGATDRVTQHIATQTDEAILHMVNADPSRTPSFTLFGNPDYYYEQEGSFGYTCPSTSTTPGCPAVGNAFAWNHGDDNPVIGNTWFGMVGPNIRHLGQTADVWTDHADLRPTMLEALGLTSSYANDGRVVTQVLDPSALPSAMRTALPFVEALGAVYKQLNAPFGQFDSDSEIVSTRAAASHSPGDAVYQAWDAQLQACLSARNDVASSISALLNAEEFGGAAPAYGQMLSQWFSSERLIADMYVLAKLPVAPRRLLCDTTPGGGH